MAKRAQIPLSIWLPAAIAAPTPISSLVHSSTLVTAGVYLYLRFLGVYYVVSVNYMLIYISFFTVLMSSSVALFIYDLKKIIAISTLSQLGLIIFFFSWGLFDIVFFHLIIHALFKSMIFMCAGIIIHFSQDVQDLRLLGGLGFKDLPFTVRRLLVSSFALSGVPYLAGFFSKDFIIEIMLIIQFNLILFFFNIILLGATIMYRIRVLIYLLKFDKKFMYTGGGGESIKLRGMLVCLSVLSIIAGVGLLRLIFLGGDIYLDYYIIFPLLFIGWGFFLCNVIYLREGI